MKKTYKITIRLLSPLHINGGASSDGRRIMLMHDGRAYIPAALFKGVMRSNFAVLMNTFGQDERIVERFFGGEGFRKSHVILDNFEYDEIDGETENDHSFELRTNVSISRYVRKSVDGALVVSEVQPARRKDGSAVTFSGEMTVYYPDGDLTYENALRKSAEMIYALGSGKSRGLGFVEVSVQ